MIKFLKLFSLFLIIGVIWSVIYAGGYFYGLWQSPLAEKGNSAAFADEAIKIAQDKSRGAMALVILEKGEVIASHYASPSSPVDSNTLFQVASLSKFITALGVMKLVEDGRLDLDTPVSQYLTRWSLPPSDFDNDGVTVRRLLSHTAGLTDGLGYGGFLPGEQVQSLEASLTQASDASPLRDGITRVGAEPGSGWRYSGGGYALLQLLIEEVTGQSFNSYMTTEILRPLGMASSTFEQRLPKPNLAPNFDADGNPAPYYLFSAASAAGIYTNAADLTRLLQNLHQGQAVIGQDSLAIMRQPLGYQGGLEIWGAGAALYAPTESGDYVFGHDGKNDPAINATARLNPDNGDGFIMLMTGNDLLASEIAGEWVFWQTGYPDFLTLTMTSGRMIGIIALGWAVLAAAFIGWAVRRRRPA